ncbi:DMT family transporter [Thalassotalea profundi]|uniref:Membrane protein n=1 Tax=Thalassotalea profundi TaxID=2036687 RepID=A0ABQ3J0X2_9GAMM|nr:DMT family transporter [Thalassotalea profundi]GHE96971.1 membrane protein [Thalassotalea profundi]
MNSINEPSTLKIACLTTIALCTFAANSVLCRLALESQLIDPASYTSIRLMSGAIALLILVYMGAGNLNTKKGSWSGGVTLFIYACTLSYGYISLDTATGALILFGAVQLTIMCVSIVKGEKIFVGEWLGIIIAFCGFVYLVYPLMSQPSFIGAILMAISGITWGLYTLIGKGSDRPLVDTCYNFVRTLPFVVVLFLFTFEQIEVTNQGILLAIISGVVTSGIGYAIWYQVLPYLATTQAAVLQLTVPVIAAIGGVFIVAESLTIRLILSSILVLGGIGLVIFAKDKQPSK